MFDFSSYFSNTAFITSKGELYTYKNVSILSEELGKYIQPHSLILYYVVIQLVQFSAISHL